MTDRKLLELAPGSRWDENGDIENKDGHSFGFWCVTGNVRHVSGSGPAVDIPWDADARDLLALLHRAGLLDELLERVWLDGYASAKYDVAETAKRGGRHETECPYSGGVESEASK